MAKTPRIFVYPYNQASESAKLLSETLGAKRLKREGSKYKPREGDVIINWGASDIFSLEDRFLFEDVCNDYEILNYDVTPVLDKKHFFQVANGSEYLPNWTTDKGVAAQLLTFPVMCRTVTNGREGRGIVIAETAAELVDAPLYVQYEKKTQEYRVHVGRDKQGEPKILGVCVKMRKRGEDVQGDPRIRNTASGCDFYWTLDGLPVVLPDKARLAALDVFSRFDLTFGGIDVIYNSWTDKAFVLEINSAPGLAPKSAELYANYFRETYLADEAPVIARDVIDVQPITPDANDFAEVQDKAVGLEEHYRPEPDPVEIGYLVSDNDYIRMNFDVAVKLLEAAGVKRAALNYERIDVV